MNQNTIDKIKRLATGGATGGERAAATEALRRADVPLDIEPVVITIPSLDEIEAALEADPGSRILIPLAMVTPTEACIYAPSRIRKPVTISQKGIALKLATRSMLVSFAPDGKSNAQLFPVYGGLGSYWFLLDEQGLKTIEAMATQYVLAAAAI